MEPQLTRPPTALAEIQERYLAAQLAGDRREALRLILEDGLGSGATVSQLQLDVVGAAQREIGRLWQENRISIAQEHMASAISQVALAQLYERAERAPANGTLVLVACVQGELHELPARLAADTLDLAGFDVRYLGADVPTVALLSMIDEVQPHLLALSATMAFNVAALRSAVERVRAHAPQLPIVVGGSAGSAIASQLEVGAAGSDAAAVVEAARRALEGGR